MFTLAAKKRASAGDNTALRDEGMIPAVFYGAGSETTPITVSLKEFEKVLKGAGESSPVILKIDGGDVSTLIHEVQLHPVKGYPVHADFLVVDMNKEVEVNVALEFVGEAPAVKGGLGILTKVLHEVSVRALPGDLPHNIEIDISSLATLDDQIHVKDIQAPKGVTILTEGEDVIALVAAAKEEVEETAPVDLSAIEVSVEKGKKEEEGAAEETKE